MCLFTDWDGTVTEHMTKSPLRKDAIQTFAKLMGEGVEVAILTAKGGGELGT